MNLRLLALFCASFATLGADLRLGVIGTDTSHAVAFATSLNDATSPDHVPGARITLAFKGGSPDIQDSASRVDRFAAELADKFGVKFVGSIRDMCPAVDGLLLESLDGRKHLAQFREATTCGKPIFVDKPLASTLADAREIARTAKQQNVPWFSSSTLRFSPITEIRDSETRSAVVWAPGPLEPHHQLDLSWYGIHGIEMLYTLLGPGCTEVSRVSSDETEVITGRWRDGRLGTVHLQRPYGIYGAIVFLRNQKAEFRPDIKVGYVPLVREIVTFMQTKNPPVANAVTLEMFGFMDAAQRSRDANGAFEKLPDTSD